MKDELICGLTWEQIQKAQQGQEFREKVPQGIELPQATAEDIALLKEHGKEGLEKMQFFGVLDRLSRLQE